MNKSTPKRTFVVLYTNPKLVGKLLFTARVYVRADVKCKIKIVYIKRTIDENLFIGKFGNFLLSLLCQRDK